MAALQWGILFSLASLLTHSSSQAFLMWFISPPTIQQPRFLFMRTFGML
uniref:Uncharacterized protein n=1 Tax=Physcomitrium patens TaxID=3218 RepID=A0A2K1KJL8_PHYPA|nr:hypothetical protein PHYPA_007644 [Physcomitrium patens]